MTNIAIASIRIYFIEMMGVPGSFDASVYAQPLMQGISDDDCFHYANGEHVLGVPEGSVLLASSSRVPVAALDFGDHCYTTQFHPEGSDQTLGTVWRYKASGLMQNYHADDMGDRLVENFFEIVKQVVHWHGWQ